MKIFFSKMSVLLLKIHFGDLTICRYLAQAINGTAFQSIFATSCCPFITYIELNPKPADSVVFTLYYLWSNLQVLATQFISNFLYRHFQIINHFRGKVLWAWLLLRSLRVLMLCTYEKCNLHYLCCNSFKGMRRLPCSMIKNSLLAAECCISMGAE